MENPTYILWMYIYIYRIFSAMNFHLFRGFASKPPLMTLIDGIPGCLGIDLIPWVGSTGSMFPEWDHPRRWFLSFRMIGETSKTPGLKWKRTKILISDIRFTWFYMKVITVDGCKILHHPRWCRISSIHSKKTYGLSRTNMMDILEKKLVDISLHGGAS